MTQDKTPHSFALGLATSLGLATCMGFFAGSVYTKLKLNVIPLAQQVQAGYVPPSDLEVYLADRDNNGIPETYMRVGRGDYILREKEGRPVLSTFTCWSGSKPIGNGKYQRFDYGLEIRD